MIGTSLIVRQNINNNPSQRFVRCEEFMFVKLIDYLSS